MDIQIRKIYRSANIRGIQVKNIDKENIGKIEEIAIDLMQGHIAYAVLSVGGFLGFNNRLFAIPWDEFVLRYDETETYFELEATKEKLLAAPGFDHQDWPKTAGKRLGI